MSSLGSEAMKKAIETGEIFYKGKKPPKIGGNSIDLRLGKYVWRIKRGFDIELKEPMHYDICSEELYGFALYPDEGYLMHSEEFIGSTVKNLNAVFHTRSTLARNFISFHQSAGFGDPGFKSRWVFEVTTLVPVFIAIGTPVGQLSFHRVEDNEILYTGKYNVGPDEWTPEHMLPKQTFFV